MGRPWLRTGLAVFAGLLLAVPLLILREFGWFITGGRQLEDPAMVARVGLVTLDALTGEPLQGIRAWAEGEGPSVRTGESGIAELVVQAGNTLLVAGGRGHALAGRLVDVPPGDSEQVLRLLPAEKLSGHVALPDGGAAAGASVEATPLEWPALPVQVPNADEDGRFGVPRAGPGSWRIEAWLEGEGRAVALVRAPDDEIRLQLSDAPLPELPGAELPPDNALPHHAEGNALTVLAPDGGVVPGALVVAAVEPDGGAPGSGLRRGLLPLQCATGLPGTCLVPADAGCLLAHAPPWADSEVECDGGTALRLREGHVLSGRVELPGAAGGWVTSTGGPLSAVGRDGRFALGPLPAGTEQLVLRGAGGVLLGRARVTVPTAGEWTWTPGAEDSSR